MKRVGENKSNRGHEFPSKPRNVRTVVYPSFFDSVMDYKRDN
jgi:hypothetical protein